MEYTEDKLTEWFDIKNQKPWQPGVYEVQEMGDRDVWHSYWDGSKFMYYVCDGVDSAYRKRKLITECETFRWRGLRANPNAPTKPAKKANKRKTQYGVLRLMPNGQINFKGSFGKKSDALVFAKKLKNKYGASHELHVCKKRLRVEA